MKNSAIKELQSFCAATLVAMLCTLASTPNTFAQAPRRLVTQEINETQRVTLRGNVHPMARAQFDEGAIADAQPVGRIYLLLNRTPEQQAALDKLMLEQLDKNSSNYHKWLTPEQYGTQFGPSDDDIETVKSWLTAQGFTGIRTNTGKTIVEFSGNAGNVRRAFSTDLHSYMVRGEKHFANVSDPQIPAALAAIVGGIPSLHNFRKQALIRRFGKFRRDVLTGEIRPLFTFTDVNGTFFGMGPADFAKIYNIPASADGTGQSIAIVGRSNINPQDVTDFRTMFGLPAYSACNLAVAQPQLCVILNGADPGLVSGDEGEADLDVEWSGAVAPKATIKFVVSESELTDAVDGVDASAVYIVDNNVAPVMSESFGLCEAANGTAGNAFQNALWQQAAAEGITVSVSSGDNGSAGCDDPNSESSATQGIAVSGTASTPFNVAVGGTDFDQSGAQSTFWGTPTGGAATTSPTVASAKGYIPEIPWNDSCATAGLTGCNTATTATNLTIVAGSGGPSSVYTKAMAPFQAGFGDATARDIPDVSFFAADGLNGSFYIICESDQSIPGDTGCNLTKFVTTSPFHDFQTVGGTSASAPAFAGIMALVNQKTGQRQGNANFVLYALAKAETFASCNSSSFTAPGTQPSTCVFMDVTKSNIAVPCVGGSPNCSKTTAGSNGVMQSSNTPAFSSGVGYDLATGLGSINVTALLNNWAVPSTKATTTTISPTTINIALGTSQAISGTVTGTPGTPTGVVIIENATTGAPIDNTTLSGNSYTLDTTLLPAGTYTIKAHYGGDGSFGPSDSSTAAVSIGKQNSKVIVSFVTATGQIVTSAQSVAYGSPYILRVDVANNAGTTCQNLTTGGISFICPTGTVALLDNGAPLNDFSNAQNPNATNIAHLNDRGFVEDQPIQLSTGTHNITATYTADASSSYISSTTTNTLALTITQAVTQTQVFASPSAVTSGGSVTLTATISSGSNSAQGPTGTVQFSNGTTNLGAPVTCTPQGATSSVGASCKAQLTTAISFLIPPANPDHRTWRTPFEWLAILSIVVAMLVFFAALRMKKFRRAYAYAGIGLFLVVTATLAGCSGASNNGGGGGGGSARTISAKYSGDTNYATSTGTGSVTIQ
jgi:subtilase family serine protease